MEGVSEEERGAMEEKRRESGEERGKKEWE